MELGKALAIAAAGMDAQATRLGAIAEIRANPHRTGDIPGVPPTRAPGCGQRTHVSRFAEPTAMRDAADRHGANLTVLQATRAMLTRVIAMLK